MRRRSACSILRKCSVYLDSRSSVWSLPPSQESHGLGAIPLASGRKQFKNYRRQGPRQSGRADIAARFANEKRWKLIFGNYGPFTSARPGGTLMMERPRLCQKPQLHRYEPALPIMPLLLNHRISSRARRVQMYSLETGQTKTEGRVTHMVKQRRLGSLTLGRYAGRLFIEIDHRMEWNTAASSAHRGLGSGQ